VALREREGRTTGLARETARRLLRLGERDVDVDDRPPEHAVTHGAADDPRLLAGEQLLDQLTNREPPA
jgi:NAD(P)-dependent dehydrogenase (short-subunit alcohol dehydrogenase family)